MQSKTVAVAVVFAAVAIALNAIRIPTIYWSRNFYGVSQIPVIIVFLLFGISVGVLVGVLNWLGALALFPLGLNGVVAYSMDFISLLVMFLGLYLASKIGRYYETGVIQKRQLLSLTGITSIVRGGIMPFVDYGLLYHVFLPLFFDITLPEIVLVGMFPVFIFYNVSTALYSIPIAYIIAKKTSKYLNIKPALSSTSLIISYRIAPFRKTRRGPSS